MKSVRTRLWAALLAIAMVVALLPVSALAEDENGMTLATAFTSVEAYNDAVYDENSGWNTTQWAGKDIYLTIENQHFTTSNLFDLRNVQKWDNPPKLHLTIRHCTFTGNTWSATDSNTSFMYLPNCQSLVIEDCQFNTNGTTLRYGINWNLCGITDATVVIRDCDFIGDFEKNALKLNQRNGTDDAASDVNPTIDAKNDGSITEIPASIATALIEDCTFSGRNAVIQLGSAGKGSTDGGTTLNAPAPSTGAFPVTIRNVSNGSGGPVTIELAYLENTDTVTPANTVSLPAGYTFAKTISTATNAYTITAPDSDPVRADLVVTRQPDGSSQPVQVQITLGRVLTGSYGGYYFDHGVATLSVEPGESLYIHDLPANMTYEIAVLDGLMTSETNASGTTLPGVYTYANFTALPGASLPEIVPGEEEIVEDGELTEGEEITGGEEEGDLQEGTEETPPEETEELPEEGLEELPEEGEDLPEEPVDVPQTGDAAPAAGAAILFGLALCALALKKMRAK